MVKDQALKDVQTNPETTKAEVIQKKELVNRKDPAPSLLSYDEVNEYPTEEIITKLNTMALPFDKAKFLKDVDVFYSAKDLSEKWHKRHSVKATNDTKDFSLLAAWILWERLAPKENFSMEQLHTIYKKGQEYSMAKEPVAACDIWLEMWEAIKYRMKPSCKDLYFFDQHYINAFYIGNFCQD